MAKKDKSYADDMGVRRRKTIYLTCRFCQKRLEIEDDLRNEKEGDFCKAASKRIRRDSEACAHFEPVINYFYCDEYKYQVNVQVCIHRQKDCTYSEKYLEICSKCNEGRAFNHFINGSTIKYNIIGGDDENELRD